MAQKTIYEQDHSSRAASDSGLSFGRITAVDPTSRLCTVKTFFSSNPALQDQHIPSCQWLNMDSNPAGDETTSIPRAGSIGMVFHVGGESFIFGFFKGLNSKGQAVTGKETSKLTEGDKVISTQGGNSITIKANRSIEIKSKETLRTLYFPTKSLMQHLCRSYEIKSDGGHQTWDFDDTGGTLFDSLYRNGQAGTNFVIEQKGNAAGGVISRVALGLGPTDVTGLYLYEQTIGPDGTVTTKVGPPGVATYQSVVGPDGSFSIQNGAGNAFKCEVAPTGDVDLAIGPLVSLSITPGGDVELQTPGIQLSASPEGDVELKALGKGTFSFTGDLEVTAVGDLKLTTLGACTLSAVGGIKLDGSGGSGAAAQFGVLTFPNVIDPLTGAPLGPGSATVLASI